MMEKISSTRGRMIPIMVLVFTRSGVRPSMPWQSNSWSPLSKDGCAMPCSTLIFSAVLMEVFKPTARSRVMKSQPSGISLEYLMEPSQ